MPFISARTKCQSTCSGTRQPVVSMARSLACKARSAASRRALVAGV